MIRFILIALMLPTFVFAQSEKIHIGNQIDNPSAILQIDAVSQGILVPRMNTVQRNAIVSPAEGLLVYDLDTHGFWYFKGSYWTELFNENSDQFSYIQSIQGNAKLQVEEGELDDDVIKFIASDLVMEIEEDQVRFKEGMKIEFNKLGAVGEGFTIGENNSLRLGKYDLGFGVLGENSVCFASNIKMESENGFGIGWAGSNTLAVTGKQVTSFGSNNSTTGDYNFTQGGSNVVNGEYNTVFGLNNEVVGNGSVVWGVSNEALASNTTVWGLNAKGANVFATAFGAGIANGIGSVAWGFGEANGNYSFCWGDSTATYTNDEIALGHHVTPYTPSGTSSDRLFVIGTGDPEPPYNQPFFNVFRILKDNSTIHEGDVEIIVDDGGSNVIGLKEETNGVLFGFEFEYDEPSENFQLRSRSFSGNDAIRMIVDEDANVGIGRTPVTNKLEINGNASKTVAGPWSGNSDRRLKKNIENMNSQAMLEKVLQMQGVSYEWNDDKTGNDRPEGIQYGFIAQDLQEIWPEKVTEDGLGFLQTAYGDYDPFFVGAFKAQQTNIEVLQDENEKLENTIEGLASENEALEQSLVKLEALMAAANKKLKGE